MFLYRFIHLETYTLQSGSFGMRQVFENIMLKAGIAC